MPVERRDDAAAGRERRVISQTGLRLESRAKGGDGGQAVQHVVGHAAVFDSWTTIYEGRYYVWREVVRKGAFSRAIAEGQDVRSLFNHNPDWILGRTASGTLTLREDEVGLLTDTDPTPTQFIADLVVAPIGRGDISQMSFAFTTNRTKQVVTTVEGVTVIDLGGERITLRTEGEKTVEERELLDLDLYDTSPVTYPAYLDTDVALRSLAERREQEIRGMAGRRSARMRMRLRLAEARTKL